MIPKCRARLTPGPPKTQIRTFTEHSGALSEIRAYGAIRRWETCAFIYLYLYYITLGIVSSALSGLNAHWTAAALAEEFARFRTAAGLPAQKP
jgi:hypothetical protein